VELIARIIHYFCVREFMLDKLSDVLFIFLAE